MLNRKDAPEGFYAMQENPRHPCRGCHFDEGEDSCPLTDGLKMYCDGNDRKDRIDVILIKEES